MIDIVRFSGEKFDLGFKEVIYFNNLKIVEGSSEEKNRKAVSNKNVDILLSPEKGRNHDYLNSRNSGLNQVILKLAYEHKVAIGFSFSDFLNSNDKASLLGRMMQNVSLCRKYKVKIVVASFAKNKYEMRHAKDLLAFARTLGMNGKEANDALNFKRKENPIKVIQNV